MEWRERQADCAQQSVMPEGRAFKFGSTSLHSMHAFMPASFATRQEARREARRSYYLFKMKAPSSSWDIIRLHLWQQVELLVSCDWSFLKICLCEARFKTSQTHILQKGLVETRLKDCRCVSVFPDLSVVTYRPKVCARRSLFCPLAL